MARCFQSQNSFLPIIHQATCCIGQARAKNIRLQQIDVFNLQQYTMVLVEAVN